MSAQVNAGINSTGGILNAEFIKYGVGYSTDFTSTIYAGSGQFQVSAAGAMSATGAAVSGTITTGNLTATGGSIGGWNISSSLNSSALHQTIIMTHEQMTFYLLQCIENNTNSNQ